MPLPLSATVSVYVGDELVEKVAATEVVWDTAMLQAPVPIQAPDQPVKLAPLAGAAERVTTVPLV